MEAKRTQVVARVVGLMMVGLLTLTACGADSFDIPDLPGSGGMVAEYAPGLADTDIEDRAAAPDSEVREEVITTGTATVSTDDPAAAAADFSATVREHGGRIADSETSTRNDLPRATVTARVPAAEFQTVLDSLADRGEVVAQSTTSTDVGQEKADLEARQRALQASIDRLSELMAGADSVEDLLRAEEMLTQRQAELDSLTGQLDWLSDRVALSTLTVTFTVDDDGYRPPNVFEQAWETFLFSLQSVIIVFMGLLPWLVVIAAIAAAVLALVRRRRRRRTRPDREEGQPEE
ncbi:DUF4349 domain-containing protein [Corynebacterium humireducens]|uniref:DUF4349 domain-containing protein n=1 Tax=Corynebacterium humireducens TaxID=1223514 RepID=UPI0009E48710|nr:DUF4349 domain-containing protein [Corynebacterium humireducens]